MAQAQQPLKVTIRVPSTAEVLDFVSNTHGRPVDSIEFIVDPSLMDGAQRDPSLRTRSSDTRY